MVGRDKASPARTRARRERASSKKKAERQRSNIQHSTHISPVALTIAGSDSSAGAGVQADLKTFSALNVYGLTTITCIVAEIPGKVSRIEPVSAQLVREQIAVLFQNFPIAAAKTGLLHTAEIVQTVAGVLTELLGDRAGHFPLVIDPVIIATSGDQLLESSAIELYESRLFPLATLITPNLDEAAKLLGQKIQDRESMEKAARALARKYRTSILLKGGHLPGSRAIDLLFAGGKITEFAAPFITGVATHGTGCTYSAAITAGLASGLPLEIAIGRAKKFVIRAITQHFRWRSGAGRNLDALNHYSAFGRDDCLIAPRD